MLLLSTEQRLGSKYSSFKQIWPSLPPAVPCRRPLAHGPLSQSRPVEEKRSLPSRGGALRQGRQWQRGRAKGPSACGVEANPYQAHRTPPPPSPSSGTFREGWRASPVHRQPRQAATVYGLGGTILALPQALATHTMPLPQGCPPGPVTAFIPLVIVIVDPLPR